jgi:glycosyltransferase involved in cell wall biosynthesis
VRVVRIYHAGRDSAHRARERALADLGVDITLVVPLAWPGVDGLHTESFEVVELPVRRSGDVNRHQYRDAASVRGLVDRLRPDVLDLHEEPFSAVTHQLLASLPSDLPVVAYTAQNIDKRWPPPFAQWESRALRRLSGLYPCSRQAASVERGKGFAGPISVLPLGVDSAVYAPGNQRLDDDVLTIGLVGRLVPEKGVLDAVRVLAAVRRHRPARLLLVGRGPEEARARALATELGVRDGLEILPWVDLALLAELYQQMHVVLVPSTPTRTWVEQFGRVVTEGRAAGAVVAAYASGSLPEVVGDAGLLVPTGDSNALADAVVALAADRARWQQLRTAGLDSVIGWDEVARGQLHLYERALSATGPANPPSRFAAVLEFGQPAEIAGGGRPFALPVLREDNAATRGLARVLDILARA